MAPTVATAGPGARGAPLSDLGIPLVTADSSPGRSCHGPTSEHCPIEIARVAGKNLECTEPSTE